MTAFFSVELYFAVIALLTLGEGPHASSLVQHVSIGKEFSTKCDGKIAGVDGISAVRGVTIFKNGTKIYDAKPNSKPTIDPSVSSWKINVTWYPGSSNPTGFNVTIKIPSAKKKDEGRLQCQASGKGKELLTYLFVHDGGFDSLCPEKWGAYPPLEKCVYVDPKMSKKWSEANSHCKDEHSGQLVVIPDQAFDEYLTSTLGLKTGKVWIGLTDKEKESTFKWTSGKEATYKNWASAPQASKTKNCVQKDMQGGAWQDEDCNKTLPFICEQKSSQGLTLMQMLMIGGAVLGGVLVIGLIGFCWTRRPRSSSSKSDGPAGEGDAASKAPDDASVSEMEADDEEDEEDEDEFLEEEDEEEEDYDDD
ncbi:macrophage mannose receptor 1 [Elysia marginata]|uniref:Macrophage mannose receptor 1 n=1 Tax=Elysia marginata TaxID=1093978 RepID=A0AAV4F8W3_9GAST|nr:macrophage mannose receptor 1 [Elysia marginata]